ncbi:peptidase [Mycolicibacterium brumae]|uniref:Peptidase n=1 Tax=Mycolicibacterium brumae TaxID=85968 RepID=A0A2G5P968_9MYCO|nr:peptidase [Mycolicibacterium brumae]MCV7193943.1 peptidase [Mycolicibacterium brumae]PIB74898.1 peptidase [Mycolicibacterium brumae]RWA22482.1 hypothetical protein MBRU_12940 [Mycolicibacterium brumae DSM 44177]UWW07991.1 peptidase [Mycolicibacterium brumae]
MRSPRLRAVLALAGIAVVVSGCAHRVDGEPVSVFSDPFQVAGMPAEDGPSGLRPDATPPTRTVVNTDGGESDHLGAQAVSDIEQYWEYAFPETFAGEFTPVDQAVSWDADDYDAQFCGFSTYGLVNAGFCRPEKTIGWDRGVLLPALRRSHGDMAITMVLAHEYGHSVQLQGGLAQPKTPTLVAEQQADCLAGAYIRWVAEGNSARFTVSTGDGLNDLLATLLSIRDPVMTELDVMVQGPGNEHGSAFERISAFEFGFTDGPSACVVIDAEEIEQRRGDLPQELRMDQTGELEITEQSVRTMFDALNALYTPEQPPTLSFAPAGQTCADARPSPPVSYCPAADTITVDLPALVALGTPTDDDDAATMVGDNSAYSVLFSRYALAIQHRRELDLDSAEAALRTGCMTGVSIAKLAEGVDVDDSRVKLAAGDLDEAVSGLLTNGLVASDVNGDTVPAGFSRVSAFRTGVLGGDLDQCVNRYR